MGSVRLSTKLVGSAGITKGIQWDPQHVELEPFGSAEKKGIQEEHIFGPGICKMGYVAGVLAAAGEPAVEMGTEYCASQEV